MSRTRNETYISSSVKWALFIFNFLFWIFGLLITVVGAYGMYFTAVDLQGKKHLELLYIVFTDLSGVLLGFGAVIFLVSFAGCIGALRENLCLLKLYFWVLTVILILELLIAIACIIFPWKSREILDQFLSQRLIEDYRDSDNTKDLVDFLQKSVGCCGMTNEGFKDWSTNIYFNCSPSSPSVEKCGVPPSCCRDFRKETDLMCGYGMQEEAREFSEVDETIYTRGCVSSLITLLESNLYVAAGIIFAITLFQMFVTHQARTLMDQISLQRSRWY